MSEDDNERKLKILQEAASLCVLTGNIERVDAAIAILLGKTVSNGEREEKRERVVAPRGRGAYSCRRIDGRTTLSLSMDRGIATTDEHIDRLRQMKEANVPADQDRARKWFCTLCRKNSKGPAAIREYSDGRWGWADQSRYEPKPVPAAS